MASSSTTGRHIGSVRRSNGERLSHVIEHAGSRGVITPTSHRRYTTPFIGRTAEIRTSITSSCCAGIITDSSTAMTLQSSDIAMVGRSEMETAGNTLLTVGAELRLRPDRLAHPGCLDRRIHPGRPVLPAHRSRPARPRRSRPARRSQAAKGQRTAIGAVCPPPISRRRSRSSTPTPRYRSKPERPTGRVLPAGRARRRVRLGGIDWLVEISRLGGIR